ncbi:hypothetical protein EJ02DRAFT_61339 [Clathrospora elynae]|uniref:Uncharacterized protein n=1 Tax=Clathrospora elynae TaxID=706981 RepID=A0A6A5SIR4_9PLEO|nr:hypothetical protein EJ02DRAFT_61339 [Clathrospora elynae]
MSARRPESQTPTGVGPHTSLRRHVAIMPAEYLPPEIWHLIIMSLDDHCFAWLVLRQVSPYLAFVTEDVFARYVSRTCSIRFAGQTLRNLLPSDLQGDTGDHRSHLAVPSPSFWATVSRLQPPTFRFQPSSFSPANTKARLVLKLCDPAIAYKTLPLNDQHAGAAESSNRLAEVFFKSDTNADAERSRLIKEAHFVRFNDQLKSIRIPSAAIDVAAQELSLDWRRLCDVFLRNEFRCRYETRSSVIWWRSP